MEPILFQPLSVKTGLEMKLSYWRLFDNDIQEPILKLFPPALNPPDFFHSALNIDIFADFLRMYNEQERGHRWRGLGGGLTSRKYFSA